MSVNSLCAGGMLRIPGNKKAHPQAFTLKDGLYARVTTLIHKLLTQPASVSTEIALDTLPR